MFKFRWSLTIWPTSTLQYKLVNDSHHQLIINWAGEGSKVVVCMTRDSAPNESSTSNVYVSYDYGTTFQDKTSKFRKASQKPAIIHKMYKNDKFTSVVSWYFITYLLHICYLYFFFLSAFFWYVIVYHIGLIIIPM